MLIDGILRHQIVDEGAVFMLDLRQRMELILSVYGPLEAGNDAEKQDLFYGAFT